MTQLQSSGGHGRQGPPPNRQPVQNANFGSSFGNSNTYEGADERAPRMDNRRERQPHGGRDFADRGRRPAGGEPREPYRRGGFDDNNGGSSFNDSPQSFNNAGGIWGGAEQQSW